MKIPASAQAIYYQLQNLDAAAKNNTYTAEDDLFADLLQAQVAAGQRVIRAEEIVSKLDGAPDWSFMHEGSGAGSYSGKPNVAAQGSNVSIQAILDKIKTTARSHGVDEDLVREVVRAESNFNPYAVSGAGAKGLMQLMDRTAQAMHVRNVYDPEENLAGGTKYLKSLLERFDGNIGVALAAYNAGPTRVSSLGITTDEELKEKYALLPQETQRYVEKILNRL
ncbi:lytic transglycosylase domain-containing protein [Brevibacillus panacihumi]|uniref:lytic transglycosylase domain-containing protein n=1 Tax=Brevibacillus panacihumi TaxID=497735 RepID=UPI003D206E57